MGEEIGFPTQGELIRFAFRFSGVLPEKLDTSLARGVTRNSVRRAVDRLAKDDGKLEDNFKRLMLTLSSLVSEHVDQMPVYVALGDVVISLLDDYQTLLSTEGTFLSKRETVRWLIRDRWVPHVVTLIAKSLVQWHPKVVLPLRPASDSWFLPDFEDAGVVWPMRKAFEWLYETAGVSQTQFHYPRRDTAESDTNRQRLLENAQNWTSGRSLPSAPALRHSLQQALTQRPSPLPALEEPWKQRCVQTVMFLARGSTAIWQAIVAEHGIEFAQQVRALFLRQWRLLTTEMRRLERQIAREARAYAISPIHPQLRDAVFQGWVDETYQRSELATLELERFVKATGSLPDEAILRSMEERHGEFVMAFAGVRQEPLHHAPPHFAEVLGECERLRLSETLSLEDVDAFAQHLQVTGLNEVLCWMPPWLRFIGAYRAGDYDQAWLAICRTFELARYRAGRSQYRIVNQFVEMAAKQGDTVAFRKGVHWARYIGLEIRWIRANPLTHENLHTAMAILAKATYKV